MDSWLYMEVQPIQLWWAPTRHNSQNSHEIHCELALSFSHVYFDFTYSVVFYFVFYTQSPKKRPIYSLASPLIQGQGLVTPKGSYTLQNSSIYTLPPRKQLSMARVFWDWVYMVNLHVIHGVIADNSRRFWLRNSRITHGIHMVCQVGSNSCLETLIVCAKKQQLISIDLHMIWIWVTFSYMWYKENMWKVHNVRFFPAHRSWGSQSYHTCRNAIMAIHGFWNYCM